jgi:hypothetical protein
MKNTNPNKDMPQPPSQIQPNLPWWKAILRPIGIVLYYILKILAFLVNNNPVWRLYNPNPSNDRPWDTEMPLGKRLQKAATTVLWPAFPALMLIGLGIVAFVALWIIHIVSH